VNSNPDPHEDRHVTVVAVTVVSLDTGRGGVVIWEEDTKVIPKGKRHNSFGIVYRAEKVSMAKDVCGRQNEAETGTGLTNFTTFSKNYTANFLLALLLGILPLAYTLPYQYIPDKFIRNSPVLIAVGNILLDTYKYS
jgi:hypothetical protein